MGQSLTHINMKMYVVLALVAVAVAEPEAKPEAQFYGGAYYNYGGSPLTTTFNHVVSPYSAYPYTYGLHRSHYYGKREADPALVYGSYVSSPLAATTHLWSDMLPLLWSKLLLPLQWSNMLLPQWLRLLLHLWLQPLSPLLLPAIPLPATIVQPTTLLCLMVYLVPHTLLRMVLSNMLSSGRLRLTLL